MDGGWSDLMDARQAGDGDAPGEGAMTGEARVRVEGGLAHFPGLAKEQKIPFGALASPEREELASLADRVDFFGCVSMDVPARPDARIYTVGLTIDGRSRDLRVAEPIRDPAMAKLVSVVRQLCRRQGGGR